MEPGGDANTPSPQRVTQSSSPMTDEWIPTPDPWASRYEERRQNQQYAQYANNEMDANTGWEEFTGVVGEPDYGAEIRREKTFDYDRPPIWDGKELEKHARMYIRMLRMWLRRTATREKDRGIAVVTNARGDLKA